MANRRALWFSVTMTAALIGSALDAGATPAVLLGIVVVAVATGVLIVVVQRLAARVEAQRPDLIACAPGAVIRDSLPARYLEVVGQAGTGSTPGHAGNRVELSDDAIRVVPGKIGRRKGMQVLTIPRSEVVAVERRWALVKQVLVVHLTDGARIRLEMNGSAPTAARFLMWPAA